MNLEQLINYLDGIPETLVMLEFIALLCGCLAAISAKNHRLLSTVILFIISSTSILISWRSITAMISVSMLFCICSLMHLESAITINGIYVSKSSPEQEAIYAKAMLWSLLFISIIGMLWLRIMQIRQYIFSDQI